MVILVVVETKVDVVGVVEHQTIVLVHPQTLVMETLVLAETKVDVVGVVGHLVIVPE
jgi:hypothetical protein